MRRTTLVALVALICLAIGAPAAAVRSGALHAVVTVNKTSGGTVTSNPGGINCGSDCSEDFPSEENADYQPIELTATPNSGYEFVGWGGDMCSGTGGCTIHPLKRLEPKTVTAEFRLIPADKYPVSVGKSGSGTVTSSPPGIDCGATCSADFDTNSTVTLTAAPAPGFAFAGWSGDCGGTGACPLTVNSPKSVTASFAPPPPPSYLLVVAKAGDGTVRSSPAGIDCGNSCEALFQSGTLVTLTAVPAAGAPFAGWGGACAGFEPTCTVDMGGPKSVTATFGSAPPPKLPFTVSKTGEGTVRSEPAGLDCGATCSGAFTVGTPVALTAAPATGWRFSGWSGACTGESPTCTVTMDAPKAAVATFVEAPTSYVLGVGTQGTGRVTSTPAGIACPSTCSASFATASSVTLRAAPPRGWRFAGWSGACAGTSLACTVAMNGALAVTATFARHADQAAPRVRALASRAQPGRTAQLRYRVTDNSRMSAERAMVYRGKRRLATLRSRLDEADPRALYYFLSWRVPKSTRPGLLRFCVTASDAVGNTSRPSCAALRIVARRR